MNTPGVGPQSDIVISSRIRLARNLADYPFISRASPQDRGRIQGQLQTAIPSLADQDDLLCIDVEELAAVDRQFLVERKLISRELADASGARSVAIGRDESSA